MSRSLSRTCLAASSLLVVLYVAVPALRSQQGQPAGPPQQPAPAPVHVAARLVQVNVIVEEHGQPLGGLKQEDFSLSDEGQPQKIAFFAEHSSVAASSAASPAPPAPNVFTNRVAQQVGVPTSVTAILLDLLNTHNADMAYARAQVVKFIEALQPQDRVALYGLSNNLYILHEFTSDSTELLRALNHYKDGESHNVSASENDTADTGDPLMDAFLNMGSQRMSDFYTVNRVETTAGALEAIGDHLASFPGRKALVWVSSSFPFNIGFDAPTDITAEHRTFSKEIEEAARSLNNANVAIYPVDARALVAGPSGPPKQVQASTLARQGATARYAIASPPPETLQTMDVIAERTGGKAFYNTNDIRGAVRRAIDDSRVSYTLAYYPTHNQWDGKFREVKVTLDRRGPELRYRKGYFAFPNGTPDPVAQKKVLADISSSPLEDTEFGLTMQIDPVPPAAATTGPPQQARSADAGAPANATAAPMANAAAPRKVATRLRFDTAQMSFQQKDGRYVDKLEIYWIQVGADGKTISSSAQSVDLNLIPDNFARVKQSGIVLNTTLDLRAECATLRVVARDQGSGIIGSLNVALKKAFAPPAS